MTTMRKIATVIGTTGVGKSQLAVELCKALQGQVINADAIQVYKGLDIITNKMPMHERQGVKHHLMDFLEPEEEYQVTEFKQDATQHIEAITNEQQLPVVVGGTNYYIQSLIWNDALIKGSPERVSSPQHLPELEQMQTPELYERLKQIDPIMANKWHPADRRKIMRSLQIFYQEGRLQSEIIKEQKEMNKDGLKPRFKSLIFWLYADPAKLNPRLDERVDKMIDTGLFDEIQDLRKRVVEGAVKTPGQENEAYQRGVWQAIGYKEFDPYFSAYEMQGKDENMDTDLGNIKDQCTEKMKMVTRRYAKRQVQWIRNKLLPTISKSGNDVVVYLLDAGDLDNWNTEVRDKAINVAKAFQNDLPLPDPASFGETAAKMLSKSADGLDTQTRVLSWKKHVCSVCRTPEGKEFVVNGDNEWDQHKSSRRHRKSVKFRKIEELGRSVFKNKTKNIE
ncbi:hypothetical protein DFQ28_008383 [Apophysomyces sp. BC1034]|nr:hypothetical protein DFQ30_008090 [Apophysomyces sp. BC1015]KAG0178463.1 hypothetical protein DFQ29_003440 [Apophysomyces sp. BC1021]KAG0186051.1 hypothetical protein DFQ28_008383 [Apophysomyces sp. BC1034]